MKRHKIPPFFTAYETILIIGADVCQPSYLFIFFIDMGFQSILYKTQMWVDGGN